MYCFYLVVIIVLVGLVDIFLLVLEEMFLVNWFNVFYVVEWVIFVGFVFYFWYCLVKDVWECEVEEFEDVVVIDVV